MPADSASVTFSISTTVGVVKTLNNRAKNVCSDRDSLANERKVLKDAFQECGYPDWAIRSGKAPSTRPESKDRDCKGFVSIPYIKGTSEPISRILQSVGLQVAMRPTNTLKQALVKPKDRDPVEDQAGVVYQISCQDCPARYIGQTGRHLGVRIKEHKRATEKECLLDSAVAEHVANSGHQINWSVDILDKDQNQTRRLVREAIKIRQNKPSLNRDQGYELNRAYNRIIQQEANQTRPSGGGNHQVAPTSI